MTDIAQLLDTYPALSPDKRAEVDVYVAEHPEWADRHAEAIAFTHLLDAAAEDTEEHVVRRLVDRRLGLGSSEPHPPDPDHAADPFAARLDDLADAEDPVRKFERLTGRLIAPAPTQPAGDGHVRGLLHVPAPDRPAAPRRARARRLPRWIATAVAVLGVTYGGLYAASASTASERDQMAALGDLSTYEAPVLRGADPGVLASRLDAVLDRVDDARHSTLGLFPTYDDEALAAVATDLGAIATEAAPETSISQEARFALGRVYLQIGRDADAARVLGTLVRESSYRAPEARRLLDYVRAQDDA